MWKELTLVSLSNMMLMRFIGFFLVLPNTIYEELWIIDILN